MNASKTPGVNASTRSDLFIIRIAYPDVDSRGARLLSDLLVAGLSKSFL